VRISEQTAAFALYVINLLVFITGVESVYSAVRTDSLYKTDYVWSLNNRVEKVFTARYGLIPYIKQITFGL